MAFPAGKIEILAGTQTRPAKKSVNLVHFLNLAGRKSLLFEAILTLAGGQEVPKMCQSPLVDAPGSFFKRQHGP